MSQCEEHSPYGGIRCVMEVGHPPLGAGRATGYGLRASVARADHTWIGETDRCGMSATVSPLSGNLSL